MAEGMEDWLGQMVDSMIYWLGELPHRPLELAAGCFVFLLASAGLLQLQAAGWTTEAMEE